MARSFPRLPKAAARPFVLSWPDLMIAVHALDPNLASAFVNSGVAAAPAALPA